MRSGSNQASQVSQTPGVCKGPCSHTRIKQRRAHQFTSLVGRAGFSHSGEAGTHRVPPVPSSPAVSPVQPCKKSFAHTSRNLSRVFGSLSSPDSGLHVATCEIPFTRLQHVGMTSLNTRRCSHPRLQSVIHLAKKGCLLSLFLQVTQMRARIELRVRREAWQPWKDI